jgi:hypothetical protein
MRARLLIVLAALLAVALAWGAQKFRGYLSSDPKMCASCHEASPDLALWDGAAHARLACQKCHHKSEQQGVDMLVKFVAGARPPNRPAQPLLGDCAGCHQSHDRIWPEVIASEGHRVHALKRKIACVRCHGAEARRPEIESGRLCQECHSMPAAHGASQQPCASCHSFRPARTGSTSSVRK